MRHVLFMVHQFLLSLFLVFAWTHTHTHTQIHADKLNTISAVFSIDDIEIYLDFYACASSKQQMHIVFWCGWLLVGFRTHLKSMHVHSYIYCFLIVCLLSGRLLSMVPLLTAFSLISLLGGRISMKLATDIRHVRGHC